MVSLPYKPWVSSWSCLVFIILLSFLIFNPPYYIPFHSYSSPKQGQVHQISLSNTHSFPTVQVIAFRHAQTAIWHGHPVPSSTTVPPLAVRNCLFSCVLGVSYLGFFHNPWDLHQRESKRVEKIGWELKEVVFIFKRGKEWEKVE